MNSYNMRAKIAFENPEQIRATISLTMTLADWKKLRDQLTSAWPSSDLGYAITDLLHKGRKSIEADPSATTHNGEGE